MRHLRMATGLAAALGLSWHLAACQPEEPAFEETPAADEEIQLDGDLIDEQPTAPAQPDGY